MKICLILGHPDIASFNGSVANAYEQQAKIAGNEVRRHNLGELQFDPILHHGYRVIQELEHDLKAARENILWCDKLVIIYPMWWGSFPAILKGFFDRIFLPGFAFKYHKNDPFWDKLLKGRSAHIISTSDGPAWWIWLMYRNCDFRTLRSAILGFCGFSPIKFNRIGNVKNQTESKLIQIRDKIICKIFRS